MGKRDAPGKWWDLLKPEARRMRREPTPAEAALWRRLAHHGRFKFRRQHVFDRFILDFYCPEARLAVEVDGPIHEDHKERDAIRQKMLESSGLHILRFTNREVLEAIDDVLEAIARALLERSQPNPSSAGDKE